MKTLSLLAAVFLFTSIPAVAGVVCEEGADQLVITRDGRQVLSYQKTVQVPAGVGGGIGGREGRVRRREGRKVPGGVGAEYGRSGFIHPISTPSGRVITDGYPVPHHAHQHGLFFAWKKATFEGETLNFWEPGAATIRHEKVLEVINEDAQAGFRVELAHVKGDRTILRETWTVKVHGETGHIDFTSEQRCVADSPLTLDKFHYGGMAVRGSRQWFPDAQISAGKGAGKDEFVARCAILTSEGLTEANGNYSRPLWVCMSGPVDAAPVLITLIPHSTNFRHPQHVRLHPTMPYFCFIPTVEESFQIEPGKPWVSRYRIIAEDGVPDSAKLDAFQKEFAGEE